MKNLTLYNEIKARVQAAMDAEANAQAWKGIAKEEMGNARTLISTAKKLSKDQEIDPKALIDFIKAEIADESAPKSDADTDLTDYRPGDFPASENNSDEVETTHPDANEEAPNASENL